MDLALNGFVELNDNEMQKINGGIGVVGAFVVGMAASYVVDYAVRRIAKEVKKKLDSMPPDKKRRVYRGPRRR